MGGMQSIGTREKYGIYGAADVRVQLNERQDTKEVDLLQLFGVSL